MQSKQAADCFPALLRHSPPNSVQISVFRATNAAVPPRERALTMGRITYGARRGLISDTRQAYVANVNPQDSTAASFAYVTAARSYGAIRRKRRFLDRLS